MCLHEFLKKYEGAIPLAQLPQNQAEPGRRWKFGDCEFIEIRRELIVRGTPVRLEAKPLEVLLHLLEHPSQVLTKDELIGAAWVTSTTDQSLTTAISKLRRAFGGSRDSIILSVSGVGYRMAVPVFLETIDEPAPPPLLLKAGDLVPGRPNWKLVKSLSASLPHNVWLAEHIRTREVLVFKFAADGIRLRALQREVTLSRLLHRALGKNAGFVRILDWDFEREPFFIESEYCGLNLFEWSETEECADLPLAGRISLAAEIAETVAAAHGLGILHNDLKPANVLVVPQLSAGAGNGPSQSRQIKVADFGVASVSDLQRLIELQITHYGSFDTEDPEHGRANPVGTAMYRAPELLNGAPPSIQGDVYALGVMLYQIVSGDFLDAPSIGWENRIADPILCEDIAAAANSDPRKRLASAAELATRLRQIEVRRSELERRAAETLAAERGRRQMEDARLRRPWLILAMAALVVGFCTSLWFAHRATLARNTAEADAAHANRMEVFTQGLFTAGDDRVPSKEMTAQMLLERGVKQARALTNDRPAQADLLQTLGEVYDAMGNFDTADNLLTDAMKEREQVSGPNSSELARVLISLSSLRGEQGRDKEALAFAQRAYQIDMRSLPPDNPQTLEAQIKIGSALTGLGEYDKAVSVLEPVVRQERGKPDRLTVLLEAIDDLGIADFYLGDFSKTLSLDVEELAIDRQRLGDAHPDIGADLINLSQLEQQMGDYAKAEIDARKSLAIYRAWFPPGHFEIASAETTLSDPLISEGRAQEALPLLLDAYRTQQKVFSKENEKTAHTLAALGKAEHALHRPTEAISYYRQAAAQYRTLFPEKDYRLASMLFNQAMVLDEQFRFPQAEAALQEALSIDKARLPAADKRLLDIRLLLGEVLLAEHKPAAAQPLLAQSYRDAAVCGVACHDEQERLAKSCKILDCRA